MTNDPIDLDTLRRGARLAGFAWTRRRAGRHPPPGRGDAPAAARAGGRPRRRHRADDTLSDGVTMADLFFASMTELARLIATKAVSPVEVTRAHLDRIAALDGGLRAYITVCGDAALEAARAAEAALIAGQPLGPLHGVPYALKDLYDTAGIRTTGGSKVLGDRVPAADATVARRLAQAGAHPARQAEHGRVRLRARGPQPALRPRRATRGTAARTGWRAAPRRARAWRWRPGWRRARSAPTPAARSASRPRCAASPGSSRPTGA